MGIDERNERMAWLVQALRQGVEPRARLNAEILAVMDGAHGVREGVDFVGTLDGAMGLIPYGSWFHWNHFGFTYVPTAPAEGIPVSNGKDYYPEEGRIFGGGRGPVAYEAMCSDSKEGRESLPRMVCLAVVQAARTPVLKELARRDGRDYLVQTANGPFVVTPEGRFAVIGPDKYLTRDGRQVPHDPEVHGHARIEAPYA